MAVPERLSGGEDAEEITDEGEQSVSSGEVVFSPYHRPYEPEPQTHVLFDSGNSRTKLEIAGKEKVAVGSQAADEVIRSVRERDKQEGEGRAKKTQKRTEAESKVPMGYEDTDDQTAKGLAGSDTFRNKLGHVGTVQKIEVDASGTTYVSISYPGNIIARIPESSIGKNHFRIRKTEE